MILFSLRMFIATLRHVKKGDVVLCVTTPFVLPYPVGLATKLRGAKAILLIYDLYPEALIMSGLARPRSMVARIIRFANGLLFPALDAIVTIGRDVEPLLVAYRNVSRKCIKLIPNWVLLPIGYRPITDDNAHRRPLAGKFIVGLSGNLGFTHSADTVYEAARLLQDDDSIHFLLSGWGSGWNQLRELCAKQPLNNVTLIERVSEEALEEFLAAANVWIIPYRQNVAGVSVPSRLYNLLAIGRPVIVTAEPFSEAALILTEENIGWVAGPEDPAALANAIRSAASDPAESQAKGQRAAHAAAKYTEAGAIASYKQLVGEIARAIQ